jgi:hemerythrin superfamily protein
VTDGYQLLMHDHRDAQRMFEEYEATGDQMIVRELCFELTLHAEAEEAVLYPALRSVATHGVELADRAEYEHGRVKDVIARIYDAAPTDVQDLVREMAALVETHVWEEENELFPLLVEAGIDPEHLGESIEAAKEAARPTAAQLAG